MKLLNKQHENHVPNLAVVNTDDINLEAQFLYLLFNFCCRLN